MSMVRILFFFSLNIYSLTAFDQTRQNIVKNGSFERGGDGSLLNANNCDLGLCPTPDPDPSGKILLKKVEEFTLYIIRQHKEIDVLKREIDNFKH